MCFVSQEDKNIIEQALKHYGFYSYDFNSSCNGALINALSHYSFFNNCSYDYGASKFVIIPDHTDYVIKIPYNAYYDEDQIYNDDDDDEIEYFYGADALEREWDYCEVEKERYDKVKGTKFKDCFAEANILFFLDDKYPIYVQEKCKVYSRSNHNYYSCEDKEKIKNILTNNNFDWYYLPITWIMDFINYFGQELLFSFLNFLRKEGWNDDLRGDNIGYINNRPVLIDFSGFEG